VLRPADSREQRGERDRDERNDGDEVPGLNRQRLPDPDAGRTEELKQGRTKADGCEDRLRASSHPHNNSPGMPMVSATKYVESLTTPAVRPDTNDTAL